MILRIVVTAVIAALLAASHWKAYVLGKDAIRVEWQAAQIEFDKAARAREQALAKQLEDARNAATKRETKLRADADSARKSAGGLRGDLAELRRRLPDLAADACRQRADTVAELFGQCAEAYRGMAEKADRHASDARTLSEGWPR